MGNIYGTNGTISPYLDLTSYYNNTPEPGGIKGNRKQRRAIKAAERKIKP